MAGVPANVAVPLPLSLNVTPPGSVPQRLRFGVGVPVAVTVKDPAVPSVNGVALALVITGAACDPALTISVNDWLALGNIPFAAEMVIG